MRRTLRIGVLVSDPFHYNAGAMVQTALAWPFAPREAVTLPARGLLPPCDLDT